MGRKLPVLSCSSMMCKSPIMHGGRGLPSTGCNESVAFVHNALAFLCGRRVSAKETRRAIIIGYYKRIHKIPNGPVAQPGRASPLQARMRQCRCTESGGGFGFEKPCPSLRWRGANVPTGPLIISHTVSQKIHNINHFKITKFKA